MNANVKGIGWVTSGGMGYGRNNDCFSMDYTTLPNLTRTMVFEKPNRNFGRMDEYSRLGLAAVSQALKDAELHEWDEKRNIGVIASTVFGCLHTDIEYYETVLPQGGILASPNLFAYTLPSSFLGEIALCFGLTGTSYTVNEQTHTGLGGLKIAMECIASQDTESMLAGVCDLGSPELLDMEERIPPGAVFLVIEKTKEDARKDERIEYGQLTMDHHGDISLNHKKVRDLKTLVQMCLYNLSAGK